MTKQRKTISVINDYSALNNKCSEFLYQPIDRVEAFGMRKENFNKVMKDPIGARMKMSIAKSYKYVIQEPLHEHRNDMAGKFQNRIDYVNISAYGFGKVQVAEGQDKQPESTSIEEREIRN